MLVALEHFCVEVLVEIRKHCNKPIEVFRWPKYIRIQRQKRILMQRLKVPPSIAQFANTVEKSQGKQIFFLE